MTDASTRSGPTTPYGRSSNDFPDLSDAETRLIEACRLGEVCKIGGAVPEKETNANKVRAGLIRFLLLGGDAAVPVHEKGVMLRGCVD